MILKENITLCKEQDMSVRFYLKPSSVEKDGFSSLRGVTNKTE